MTLPATGHRKLDSWGEREHGVGVLQAATHERRRGIRASAALDLRLVHKAGRPVTARTLDLGVGGAHVLSSRPLRIDEEMRFDVDLPPAGRHVEGIARVLRQDGHNRYALRFERVAAAEVAHLRAFLAASVDLPLQ